MNKVSAISLALAVGSLLILGSGGAWLAFAIDGGEGPVLNTGVITGEVRSSAGAEAGVWVIAETDDLDTKFRKIVVTNDEGEFLLPELPDARFEVWVRGYGLNESERITAVPGDHLSLEPTVAQNPQEAAQFYPANYWMSMLHIPDESEFPGTGPDGNGIGFAMETRDQYANQLATCARCHQLGNEMTRTIPDLDDFASSIAAWDHRVQRGIRGGQMSAGVTALGRERALAMFADWSDRIAAGEVPSQTPPRPSGIEQNVVITMWNWGDSVAFMHDARSTDKRNPTLNAYGPIYGTDVGNDWLTVVDPVNHTAEMFKVTVRDETPAWFSPVTLEPWRHFGEDTVWENHSNPHCPLFDHEERVWVTTQIRPAGAQPEWCGQGSGNPYAENFPLGSSGRQLGYLADPETGEFVHIDTCFGTHHLQLAEDEDNTIWVNGGVQEFAWFNTRVYFETGDEEAAQGWCPRVIDTSGDGRITRPWNEPGEAFDPSRDTRLPNRFAYSVMPSPVDDGIWYVDGDEYPGWLWRFRRGANPPETCITERYEVPVEQGYRLRGVDVDRDGVVWVALAGSSHYASFDRRRCEVLNGPETLDGRHCDEGWTFYPTPEATFEGTDLRTDFHYFNWVDQFNTSGLGENTPIATGSNSDSLLALDPDTGEWVILRVPYPHGFYTRGIDGRIDDPDGGWKGRGLYTTYAMDAGWHVEGGPHEPGNLVKIQIRPDPLAR